MHRSRVVLIGVAVVVALALTGCGGSAAEGLTTIGAGLQGPSGVRATVYTTGLSNVAAFAFDTRGRLWVATADYSDSGNDGVYLVAKAGAKPVKVVTGLHTPLGLLWYRGSLYVTSTGRVDAYRDLANNRFGTRTRILDLPDGVGESNTIVLGSDGRMLMGISASCDHCTPASKWSGAIVSFLPDGSDLRVYTSGIHAPIGLASFPGTDELFVSMNQRDDLDEQTPGDWLASVKDGQSWGFPACYGQDTDACADVPEPVAELDTHAAAADVAIVTGELGASVGTAALIAEWAKGTVLQVPLRENGSTSERTAAPFVTGLKNPVALITHEDSVFVGDWATGTIYRITEP